MKALFILGVDQDYRPERWRSRHHVYSHLARGLASFGIHHHLYANPASVKSEYLHTGRYSYSTNASLDEVLSQQDFTHAFIWGGRTNADRNIRDRLVQAKIRCLYAEAGWFPQSGHCYVSEHGTNAECQLNAEGLREHIFDAASFNSVRRGVLRNLLGLWHGLQAPAMTGNVVMNTGKPILLPLQDEGDTNIQLSSPIRSMTEFVRLFAERYPDTRFIARPHPRSPIQIDLDLPNVVVQDSKTNPYIHFKDYGGIIGINSTTLLQFSLLGLPVCGIGQGIGSGTGAYHDLDIFALPADLGDISCDLDQSRTFYDFLIRKKQLENNRLSQRKYLATTYIPQYFGL
ncbi:MAG: hypothetical protein V4624_04125 [Pseudomonadota bacterium]